jgi:hypothetical protein
MDEDSHVPYETLEEAMRGLEEDMAKDAPPGAEYRYMEYSLGSPGEGRALWVIEEVVPGDDPDKRRRWTLEAMGEPLLQEQRTEDDYDVAVSFAGEDRDYVEQVVARLRDLGIRVFYDRDQQARLWGRNLLEELTKTYRDRAFRTLIFISRHYADKKWPREERRAAQDRAMETVNEPYILPVRLDDSELPGLHRTTGYVDGRTMTGVEVAELVVDHLRQHGRDVGPPPMQRDMAERVGVRAIPGKTPDGEWEVPYRIYNAGDYPIHNVVLVIDDPGMEGGPGMQEGTAREIVIGTLNAQESADGREKNVKFFREPVFGELTMLAVVLFSDRWDNNWAVSSSGVTRMKNPPRVC